MVFTDYGLLQHRFKLCSNMLWDAEDTKTCFYSTIKIGNLNAIQTFFENVVIKFQKYDECTNELKNHSR